MKKVTRNKLTGAVPVNRKALWISDKLHKRIKVLSSKLEIPMSTIAEESLQQWVEKQKTKV